MDRVSIKRTNKSYLCGSILTWCLGAVVLLAWGAGCNDRTLAGASCFSADDCPTGSRCIENYCVAGEGVWTSCHDVDGDGFFVEEGCGTKVDCDDSSVSVYPGAEEACDLVDNDCDGEKDEAFPDLGDKCMAGKGICRTEGQKICNLDKTGTACNAQTPPKETETCNGKDDNCNGIIDDLPGEMDAGNQQMNVESCGRCGIDCRQSIPHAAVDCRMGTCALDSCRSPWVDLNDDESDGCEYECGGKKVAEMNGESLPAEDLRCDGIDDDCDGDVDEDVPKLGDECTSGQGTCKVEGTVVCKSDDPGTTCDAQPGSPVAETCDGKDNDCDGEVDEEPTDGETWYRDRDSDGYGDKQTTTKVCAGQMPPSGYVDRAGDCRDGDDKINSGANERCNNKDDDCDGQKDEGLPTDTYYRDRDGDQFGDPNTTRESCHKLGNRWVSNNKDCRDQNPQVNPSASEICDGKDNDCNGKVDDGVGRQRCSNQRGVCSGSKVTCQNGGYPACGAGQYGSHYESTESSCDDGKDNDCDGKTDCTENNPDPDCSCD